MELHNVKQNKLGGVRHTEESIVKPSKAATALKATIFQNTD